MEVPFVNLARQFSNLKPQLIDIFSKIGESGYYILGERHSVPVTIRLSKRIP